jgi:ABC-type transport system involved in multi-copper enzyme maturation permease subunit
MGDRLAAWATLLAERLFGPVFALDAARVGRRFTTFLIRWLYLLILAGVLGVFFYTWRSDLRAPGGVVHPTVLTRFAENFFWVYSVTQFLVVCALTPVLTAGAITDEKERKTLDFLLVTTLSGREILFGKLAARVGELLTFVLAGLPIVALMQLFGGIEPRLLLFATAMTLATVMSMSAISLALSVQVSRTREAVLLAYAVPLVYLLLPWFAWDWLSGPLSPGWRSAVETFMAGNPFEVVRSLGRDLGSAAAPNVVAWYVGFHLVVAILGFAFAALRLRAMASGAVAVGPRGKVRRFVALVLGRRTEARKHPPVGDSPVFWREVYVDPGSGGGFLRRLLILALFAAVVLPFLNIVTDVWFSQRSYSSYRYSLDPWKEFHQRTRNWVCGVTCGLGMLMLLRATARGASAVAGERDRDTWASLLATPLTAREILWGKWAGCVWGQRGLMYLLAGVWAVGLFTGSVNPFMLVPTVVALAAYLNGFAWLGLRYSVKARNSRVAIARAVPLAIFLGGGFWVILGCCAFGIGNAGGGRQGFLYIGAFAAGITPPFVLAGAPAVDFEVLRDIGRHGEAMAAFSSLVCGGVLGALGWTLLAGFWSQEALSIFAKETNRRADELPQATPPIPGPPRAGPPGSSGTAAAS